MIRVIGNKTLIPYTCENILQARKRCKELKIKFKLVDNWLLVDQRKIKQL